MTLDLVGIVPPVDVQIDSVTANEHEDPQYISGSDPTMYICTSHPALASLTPALATPAPANLTPALATPAPANLTPALATPAPVTVPVTPAQPYNSDISLQLVTPRVQPQVLRCSQSHTTENLKAGG